MLRTSSKKQFETFENVLWFIFGCRLQWLAPSADNPIGVQIRFAEDGHVCKVHLKLVHGRLERESCSLFGVIFQVLTVFNALNHIA